jgi:hypothetical protein
MDMIDILIAVPQDNAQRYQENLSHYENFNLQIVTDVQDALDILDDRDLHSDVFVIDNRLGDVYTLVKELRNIYPRLLIIIVDEEADFGMPGQADDMSTEPFDDDDLAKRITRLISERRVETLRSDSLPAVRAFAKQLRSAAGALGKLEAAVQACQESGYDYVAYYQLETTDPFKMILKAQVGPAAIQSIAPKQAAPDDLMAWVAKSNLSRIAAPQDTPNHPLVARGRLGAVACVPVMFSGNTFGVLVACRDRPGSINQENILMLELIGAQLAGAISKESMA